MGNFLSSKINPPKPRQLLSRPRLLTRLERVLDYKVLLVSAGTGFGKTTLLTDFARQSQLNLTWYALDEDDRDPAQFCRYLLQSVRIVYPSFGSAFEEMLEQNLTQLHQEAILYRLAEEFVISLDNLRSESSGEVFRETVLVLDDFQFAESFAVNRFVQRLIWRLPEGFHLILSSRVLPEDLMITRLLAKQMMTIIGPGDMVFTAEEVNTLIRELHGVDEPELGEALATYSEGWITGIVLTLANHGLIQGGGWRSLKAIPGNFDVSQLFEYLAEEVFETQSPELQNFLLRSSVFSAFTPEMCHTLLEDDNHQSAAILKQVEARNLFIMRLSSEEQAYFQYHALFRQFLLTRLKQNATLYQTIQHKAAQVQKSRGNFTEAVQHYVAAGEVLQAANLLNEIARPLYEAGRIGLLNNLLEMIPAQEQKTLPHLVNVKARLLTEKGDNQGALEAFGEAERLYRQEQQLYSAALATANQAQLLLRTGQRLQALSLANQVQQNFATLMQAPEGQQAVALTKVLVGMIATEQGEVAKAETNLQGAAEIYKACHDQFRLASVDGQFGHLYHSIGRLVKSTIYYERALAYFVKVGNVSREAYTRTSLATDLYLQGHYNQAEKQLNETLALSQDLNDFFLRIFVLAYLANICRETERYHKANTFYAEALQLTRQGQVRKMELLLLNNQATTYLLESRKDEAHALIQLSLELAEDYALPERAGLAYLNQGWLEFDNRAYKRALISVEKATAVFTAAKSQIEISRCLLHQAIILLAMGEPRKALTTFTESLEISHDLGFEPFLPYEIKRATALFEYVSRKKITEEVEVFLRKRGYLSKLPGVPVAAQEAQENLKEDDSLPAPIQLVPRLTPNWKTTPADGGTKNLTPASFPAASLRVCALNGGRVWLGEAEIENWRTTKSREALFYLLEHQKCSRDELLEALWSDENLQTSSQLLRTNLFHLRKAIAPIDLKFNAGRYYLEGSIWYDAGEFNSELKEILGAKKLDAERLNSALSLYKRDYLDQFYSNWCVERQQQLLQLYLSGLETLARYYQDKGQPQTALPFWRQMLLKDPYNEATHQATINCLLAIGNKSEARRQSLQCLKALEELDVKPSPETTLLLQKLA